MVDLNYNFESDWLITSKVIGFLNDNKLYANNLASEYLEIGVFLKQNNQENCGFF